MTDLVTRRAFVKAGACALVGTAAPPRFLLRAAHAAAGSRKVLVAVFQRGAVDGLSMIPSHGDAAFTALRAATALPGPDSSETERTLDLDGFFGLHPALAPLVPLWQDRALAIVHACGSPDATRSHFDAQDYMETGTPGVKRTADGWLSRAVTALPPRPSAVRAVAIGPSLPRILRGDAGAVAVASLRDADLRRAGDARIAAARGFESLYEQGVHDLLHGTGRETFEVVKTLKAVRTGAAAPAHGARYPRGRFGEALRQIAQLIRADVGLEVAFADMGGWDTHVAQGGARGQLASRLGEFAGALAAFCRDLGGRMADVVVLTMSEFGRTVGENGNGGTDHGHGTAMLVMGSGVRGGRVYGRWPGLAREQLHESRDLAVTTDFRQLFAEVAVRGLGVPVSASLFPEWPGMPPLGLFGA